MPNPRPVASTSRPVHAFARLALCACGLVLAPAGWSQGSTQCASVSSAEVQGNGSSYWGNASADRYLSADARFVAFHSDSSNLTPGDVGAWSDVFVRDTLLGVTECVSVSSAGVYGDGASRLPSISADGRFVAFDSDATNLVPGDTNGLLDVFVRDRTAGTITRVSLSTAGLQANGPCGRPSISADGRFVAFQSSGTSWIPGKVVALQDIFVRDRLLGATEWINPPLGGGNNNHHSGNASISDDGRFVAFESLAGNVAPASFDTQYTSQIYLRDRLTATSEWISVCTPVSGESCDSTRASISGDGLLVAYESDSTTAVPNDTNGKRDIFVRDRQGATTERINVSSAGAQAVTIGPSVSTGSGHAAISRDGRYVAFKSYATNLDPTDATAINYQDIFVRDRLTSSTTIESVNSSGAQALSESEDPAISSDGSAVAFASFATNLMPIDTNFAPDIFLRIRANSTRFTYCTAGTSTHGCVPAISGSGSASVSASSGFVLDVANVEGQKQGLFFYGVSGQTSSPWSAGSNSFLCVKSPTQRMSALLGGGTLNGCDGAFSQDWLAYVASNPSALGAPYSAGQVVNAQAWYRDPPAVKTTNLSNGLEFTLAP